MPAMVFHSAAIAGLSEEVQGVIAIIAVPA
jgi:hypothetical protein